MDMMTSWDFGAASMDAWAGSQRWDLSGAQAGLTQPLSALGKEISALIPQP